MNKTFVIYDSTTGKIIRIGSCPEEDIQLQVKEGECVLINVKADPQTQCIDIQSPEHSVVNILAKNLPKMLSSQPQLNKLDDALQRIAALESQMREILAKLP